MKKVYLLGDCHSTRIWEHWDPENCPVDFKAWGVAGMTAWSFDPERLEKEQMESNGIENVNHFVEKDREYFNMKFNEFKDADVVLVWLGYVDVRQRLAVHKNAKEDAYQLLDRICKYYPEATIQIIEPLPQFTEMLLKYEGISPSYTYEERQEQNAEFCASLNEYAELHSLPKPITQQEIKDAVGIQEFTPEYAATWAPHPQDSLKREYWAKIYDLFISKASKL